MEVALSQTLAVSKVNWTGHCTLPDFEYCNYIEVIVASSSLLQCNFGSHPSITLQS